MTPDAIAAIIMASGALVTSIGNAIAHVLETARTKHTAMAIAEDVHSVAKLSPYVQEGNLKTDVSNGAVHIKTPEELSGH